MFNPFERVPVAATVRRDITLPDEKIVAVWWGIEGSGSFAGIVRTVSLTGQRREEVAGMTWNELDDDLSIWTIPPARGDKWRLDEVVISIAGEPDWLWRAVDQNGFVLDVLVQRRREGRAAQRLMRKLLKSAVTPPRVMVTGQAQILRRGARKAGSSPRASPA